MGGGEFMSFDNILAVMNIIDAVAKTLGVY